MKRSGKTPPTPKTARGRCFIGSLATGRRGTSQKGPIRVQLAISNLLLPDPARAIVIAFQLISSRPFVFRAGACRPVVGSVRGPFFNMKGCVPVEFFTLSLIPLPEGCCTGHVLPSSFKCKRALCAFSFLYGRLIARGSSLSRESADERCELYCVRDSCAPHPSELMIRHASVVHRLPFICRRARTMST